MGSLLLGCIAPLILNLFYTEQAQNERSYKAFSDYLGLLFFRAQLKEKPVMITMQNGKVYIGFVHGCNTPGKHDGGGSIYVQPTLSGYRTGETHEMRITTDYTETLQAITRPVEESRQHLATLIELNLPELAAAKRRELQQIEAVAREKLDDLKLAISVAEIVTAVVFDKSVYGRFNPAFSASPTPARS